MSRPGPDAADAPVDVLAVGAHPDDVELGCGATRALLAGRGRRVGIVHLTRGEAGTRGTTEERRREAEKAAAALGAVALDILDCGDGALRTGRAEEDALIAVVRRLRPELVLAPPPGDRHPDHGRAHRLTAAACFYAGLAGRRLAGAAAALEAHRPGALFWYMQHDPFDPAFVVDVTAGWAAKRAALACYTSQLHASAFAGGGAGGGADGEGGEAGEGPATKVASREFALAVEGRARHFGQLVNAELGEPFGSAGPLAVGDPLTLVPGGIR